MSMLVNPTHQKCITSLPQGGEMRRMRHMLLPVTCSSPLHLHKTSALAEALYPPLLLSFEESVELANNSCAEKTIVLWDPAGITTCMQGASKRQQTHLDVAHPRAAIQGSISTLTTVLLQHDADAMLTLNLFNGRSARYRLAALGRNGRPNHSSRTS